MKKIINTPWSIAIIGSVLFLCYFLSVYPSGLVIADEHFYFHQAFALSQFKWTLEIPEFSSCTVNTISILPGDYPLGTAFVQALIIFLFGKHAVFYASAFWVLVSYLLFFSNWVKNDLDPISSLLFLCSPVCLFYSKTLMSDIPSLFFGVIAFSFYLKYKSKMPINTFFLGFIASVSILFRETNILLFLPLLLYLRRNRMIYFGLAFGVFLRLICSYFLFGNPFFIKDSGCGFTAVLFLEHSLIFLSFIIICNPGIIFFTEYTRKNLRKNVPMSLVVLLFFLCYSMYDYDSLGRSGRIQGVLLYLRFYLPILPFIVYFSAGFNSSLRNKRPFLFLRISHGFLICCFVFALNTKLESLYNDQIKTKEFIMSHLGDAPIFREYELNQYKLINYFHFDELPISIMYDKQELTCYLNENRKVLLLSGNNFEPRVDYRELMNQHHLSIGPSLRNSSYSAFILKAQ